MAHGFEERNPQLVANWNNGKKGGRPKTRDYLGLTQNENGFNKIKPEGKGGEGKVGKDNREHAAHAATNVALSEATKKAKGRRQSGAFQPPTLEAFIDYGISKGIGEQDCREQFDIWEAGVWKDGNGTPIRNWEQKLLTFQKIGNLPSHKRASINRGRQDDAQEGKPHLI